MLLSVNWDKICFSDVSLCVDMTAWYLVFTVWRTTGETEQPLRCPRPGLELVGNIEKFISDPSLLPPTHLTLQLPTTFSAWESILHSSSVQSVLPALRSLTPPSSARDVPSSPTSEMEINDIYDFILQIMYHWILSIIRLLISCCFSPVIRIVEE